MKFKTITNCCVVCRKPTKNPNPFYICEDCKKLDDTAKRLIKKYFPDQTEIGIALDNENIVEMFKQILESHMVSTSYIVKMLDEMDKMPEWRANEENT